MRNIVAIIGNNSEAYINAIFDCWERKEIPALIDPEFPEKVLKKLFVENGIIKCYVNKQVEKKLDNNNIIVKFLEEDEHIDFEISSKLRTRFCDLNFNDISLVLFSSGSTGISKGIWLSCNAIIGNAKAIIDYMGISENDSVYIVKKLSHSSTLTGELVSGLLVNADIKVANRLLSGHNLLYRILKYNISIVCVNPTILKLMLDSAIKNRIDLPSLKKIYVSGSICSEDLISRARQVFSHSKVFNVYGLSEMGPRVTAQTERYMKGNSCGTPIRGVEIKVCDNYGNRRKIMERGNIYVKSPYRMLGYLGDGKSEEKEMWFNTKDIGYIDKDGELFIVGREDSMLNVYSHNVYPEEIEKLAKMHSNVRECLVIGKKDSFEENKLLCVIEPIMICDENVLIKELRIIFKNNLASYEIPTEFKVVEKIPRTPNGKVSRRIGNIL